MSEGWRKLFIYFFFLLMAVAAIAMFTIGFLNLNRYHLCATDNVALRQFCIYK